MHSNNPFLLLAFPASDNLPPYQLRLRLLNASPDQSLFYKVKTTVSNLQYFVVSPNPAYPIHQWGVIMAEGEACMLPMPNPAAFLNGLEDATQVGHVLTRGE